MPQTHLPISETDIQIKSFQREDIIPLVDYWTNNSDAFWRERGIDKSKLKTKEDFKLAYEKLFIEKGQIQTFATIYYCNKPIGIHSLTELIENESAVFHAHIWYEEYRGRGIGVISYIKALDYFFKTLNLKKIIFKTPKINLVANKIKQKIGIQQSGETLFDSPVLIRPLEANLYEVTIDLLQQLKKSHNIIQ